MRIGGQAIVRFDGSVAKKQFKSVRHFVREVWFIKRIRTRRPQAPVTELISDSLSEKQMIMRRYNRSLKDALEDDGYREGRHALSQIIHIVSVLQSLRISHMDIKPANLMENRGFVILVDFASSTMWSGKCTYEASIPWMAPEVAMCISSSKRGDISGVDIWALGVIALEISYPDAVHGWFENENAAIYLSRKAIRLGWGSAEEYFGITDPSGRVCSAFLALDIETKTLVRVCFICNVQSRRDAFQMHINSLIH